MKVIFLEINGVIKLLRLRHKASGYGYIEEFDRESIGLINKLIEADPKTRVVISSSWSANVFPAERLPGQLRAEGFNGQFHDDWRTPRLIGKTRGEEISAWLSKHPEVTAYICIGHDKDSYSNQPLVQTNIDKGFAAKDFKKASEMLFRRETEQGRPSFLQKLAGLKLLKARP